MEEVGAIEDKGFGLGEKSWAKSRKVTSSFQLCH
jgi:hypothetical protein